MKKTITLLFVLFLAFQAQAQVTVKPGVRAGLNVSNLTNSNLDSKTDFYVGGLLAIRFARIYTLQPELTYTRQGAKYNSDFAIPAYPGYTQPDDDLSIQYLSLAAMNKFHFGPGFHAAVGPTLDFKVGDNYEDFGSDEDVIGLDMAIIGGLGYTLPMGLTVEARYKLGLIDIFGDPYRLDEDEFDDYNGNYDDVILNSVIQLGVSYAF